MLNKIIEQWLGEEKKDDLESSQSINESIIRINQLAGYNWALKDLKSRIPELEGMIVGEIEKIYILLAKEQIDLCHGKLPYVIFGSKATEQEAVQLYRKGLEDFRKHIITSLKGGKE